MFYIRPRSSFPNTGELLNLYKKSRGKSSQILVYIFSCCYDKTQKIIFIFSQEEDWVMHVGHKSFLAKIKPSPPTAFQVCAPTRPQTTSDHYELDEKKNLFRWISGWNKCIDILSVICRDIYCNKEYLEVSYQKVTFRQSHS